MRHATHVCFSYCKPLQTRAPDCGSTRLAVVAQIQMDMEPEGVTTAIYRVTVSVIIIINCARPVQSVRYCHSSYYVSSTATGGGGWCTRGSLSSQRESNIFQ